MPTPNREYATPTVGGSPNVWGAENNALLGEPGNDISGPTPPLASPNIDEDMQVALDLAAAAEADAATAQARADATLPKDGSEAMTGRLINDIGNAQLSITQTGLNGPANLDVGVDFHFLSIVAQITIAFLNTPALNANYVQMIVIEITSNGNHLVTWPGGIVWNMGVVPLQTAGGQDTYVLYRVQGGPWVGTKSIAGAA